MSKDERRFIETVTLLNKHNVYGTTANYIIESTIGENGQLSTREYPMNKINIIRNLLKGSELSVDEAVQRIEKSPHKKILQNQYGPKKNNEVQDILICLVAIGKSTCNIEGSRYVFKVL